MIENKRYRRIVVGGCFLILHPGHLHMLKQAKAISEEVWVVVASNNVVKKKYGFVIEQEHRAKVLDSIRYVDRLIRGKKEKDYEVLKEVDAVGLGYDQEEEEIKKLIKIKGMKKIEIVRFKPYFKDKYSTSLILKRIRGVDDGA